MNRHHIYIAAHKALGLCVSCASPAAPGRLRCEAHLAYHRELRKRLVAEHAAAGLCSRCSSPAYDNLTLCSYHLSLQRQANDRYYRKKVGLTSRTDCEILAPDRTTAQDGQRG